MDHGVELRIQRFDAPDCLLDQINGIHAVIAHKFGQTEAVVLIIIAEYCHDGLLSRSGVHHDAQPRLDVGQGRAGVRTQTVPQRKKLVEKQEHLALRNLIQ